MDDEPGLVTISRRGGVGKPDHLSLAEHKPTVPVKCPGQEVVRTEPVIIKQEPEAHEEVAKGIPYVHEFPMPLPHFSASNQSCLQSLSPHHDPFPQVVLQRIPEMPCVQENAPSYFRSATWRSNRHVFPTSTSPTDEPIDIPCSSTRRSSPKSLQLNSFGFDSK